MTPEGAERTFDARLEVTRQTLQGMRKRLLDLSNRNKLLNYKHRDSARQLRLVDISLESLLHGLNSQRELLVRGLPDPAGNRIDAELSVALERARLLDPDYQSALRSDDEASITKADGRLTNNLRGTFGLRANSPTALEVARARGIDPNYDLPITSGENNSSPVLQSLFFDEALNRKLSAIRDETITTLQELGINTLYVAVGFLEWYESDSSLKALHSPLIIIPIELIRKTQRGTHTYKVKGIDEELEGNITLEERLRQDFELTLPSFRGDITLTNYFVEVQDAIRHKPRWRIRSFSTIGLFNFTRLSMYRDLDSSRRQADEQLEQKELILDLLGGVTDERRASLAVPVEPISVYHHDAPAIIADADASQYNAILEALAGKNFVIEGPPGTGKSQTITNIIASAINDGKTVLFVAEKLAALEVVKARLDHAGLGDFCLELHSTKTRKTDFYNNIKSRLNLTEASSLTDYSTAALEAQKLSTEIDQYCAALHRFQPSLSLPLFDLIWREQELRSRLGDYAKRLQGLPLPDLHKIDRLELESLKTKILEFTDRLRFITTRYGSVAQHPLSHVPLTSSTRNSVVDLRTQLELLQQTIDTASAELTKHRVTPDEPDTTWSAWASLVALASAISQLQQLPKSATVDVCSQFPLNGGRLLSTCAELIDVESVLATSNPSKDVVESSRCTRLIELSDKSGASAFSTIASFLSMADDHRERLNRLKSGLALLSETRSALSCDKIPGPKIASAIINCAKACANISPSAASLFTPHFYLNAAAAKDAIALARQLRERFQRHADNFHIDADLSTDMLLAHAASLQDAKWHSFLSPSHRAAVRFFRAISKVHVDTFGADQGRQLKTLATDLQDLQRFEHDQELRQLFGATFRGVDTDFEFAVLLLTTVERLRGVLAAHGLIGQQLEHVLLNSTKNLNTLVSVARDDRFSALDDVARVISEQRDIERETTRQEEHLERLETIIALWNDLALPRTVTINDLKQLSIACKKRSDLLELISKSSDAMLLLGQMPSISNLHDAVSALTYIKHLRNANVSQATQQAILSLGVELFVGSLAPIIIRLWQNATEAARKLEGLGLRFITPIAHQSLSKISELCSTTVSSLDLLPDWIQFNRLRAEVNQRGLESFGALCLSEPTLDVALALEYCVTRAVVESGINGDSVLPLASGVGLNESRRRFREVDRQFIARQRLLVRRQLAGRPIPSGNAIGRKGTFTELALLKLEAFKTTRFVSIRELMKRGSRALQAIKPCFMMSPLSVAQYIEAGTASFDIVVIDEASQMRPEDALGAISRASQLIVVGDPKQLPPTSFFDRLDTNDEVADEDADDASSILDIAMQQFGEKKRLIWHYRSRHDSLIAFSNQHFYENELVVFPSADQGQRVGVKLRKVAGSYAASLNLPEAEAIASRAIEIMETEPEMSLAVVAMNQPQRDLIRMEIERQAASNRRAQEYIERWESEVESFIVKNLESIQGDERDVVLISTVYGPNKDGRVLQHFGPINNVTSGWRRLNVLLTRAKYRTELYTSLKPSDIVLDERTGRGARALHDYIDFAGSGRLVEGRITGRAPDSDFEVSVARALEQHGFDCVPQIGVGGYFIDIGVIDPTDQSRFLIGIECDGSAYHSTKSARDRDRLRQDVLERLGWQLHRIWSTDWFADPGREVMRLVESIKTASQQERGQRHGDNIVDVSAAEQTGRNGYPVKLASRTQDAPVESRQSKPLADMKPTEEAVSPSDRTEGSLYSSEVVEAILQFLPEEGLAPREDLLEAVARQLGLPLTKRLKSIVNKTIMSEVASRRLRVDSTWTRIGRM